LITLHRLGHQAEKFHLNPDLIMTVEANPDTVITLTTQTKVIVAEPPERVIALVERYRIDILGSALLHRTELRTQRGPSRPGTRPNALREALADHVGLHTISTESA
jgi:flagellar protein FlbD